MEKAMHWSGNADSSKTTMLVLGLKIAWTASPPSWPADVSAWTRI
jgi:hypothetical protein